LKTRKQSGCFWGKKEVFRRKKMGTELGKVRLERGLGTKAKKPHRLMLLFPACGRCCHRTTLLRKIVTTSTLGSPEQTGCFLKYLEVFGSKEIITGNLLLRFWYCLGSNPQSFSRLRQ